MPHRLRLGASGSSLTSGAVAPNHQRFTVICRDSPVIVPDGQPLGGLPVREGAKPTPSRRRPHPDSFAAAGMRGGDEQDKGGFGVGGKILSRYDSRAHNLEAWLEFALPLPIAAYQMVGY